MIYVVITIYIIGFLITLIHLAYNESSGERINSTADNVFLSFMWPLLIPIGLASLCILLPSKLHDKLIEYFKSKNRKKYDTTKTISKK